MNLDFALVLSTMIMIASWSLFDFFLAKTIWGKLWELLCFLYCGLMAYALCFVYPQDIFHFESIEYIIYSMLYVWVAANLMYRGLEIK